MAETFPNLRVGCGAVRSRRFPADGSRGQPALSLQRAGALWHLASLDAPTVAIVWALAFAWAVHVRLPVWVPLLLALVTWVVYIGDRLLDARRALTASRIHQLQERHRFHWRHKQVLVPLAVSAAVAAAGIVFTQMPAGAVERNSVLAAVTLAYFTGVHAPRTPNNSWIEVRARQMKQFLTAEFLVGLLFTAGCVLPAFGRAGRLAWPALAAVAVYFVLLAWLNCFAIQRWEARSKGHSEVVTVAFLAWATGLVFACAMWGTQPRIAYLGLAGAASALLLALLDLLRGRLSPLALRVSADLVLLTPFLLLVR